MAILHEFLKRKLGILSGGWCRAEKLEIHPH
jgi:hypothetical protein